MSGGSMDYLYVRVSDAEFHINSLANRIDRLIRRRMAEAWKEIERLREDNERLRADLATQQGCCDGAAAQDAHIRREREEHRAQIERLREEMQSAKADAWDDGYQDHKEMIEGIARKPSNPYR